MRTILLAAATVIAVACAMPRQHEAPAKPTEIHGPDIVSFTTEAEFAELQAQLRKQADENKRLATELEIAKAASVMVSKPVATTTVSLASAGQGCASGSCAALPAQYASEPKSYRPQSRRALLPWRR